jgi:hypothetical protein
MQRAAGEGRHPKPRAQKTKKALLKNTGTSQMRIVAASLIFAIALCSSPSSAENCGELYAAIKRTAAYCDFVCDERELAPLQKAYEASCIVMYVPLSAIPFEEPWSEIVQRGAEAGESLPASQPAKFETALNIAN